MKIKYLTNLFKNQTLAKTDKEWKSVEAFEDYYEEQRQILVNSKPEYKGERRVDKLKSFEANGNTYTVVKSLPIVRYEILEQQQIRTGYKVTIPELFNKLNDLWKLNKAGETNDIAVILHNLITGIKEMGNQHNPLLVICSLYIVRDGENLGDWSQEMCDAKIKDWKEASISMESFFSLALNVIETSMSVYEGDSRTTLKEKQAKAKTLLSIIKT